MKIKRNHLKNLIVLTILMMLVACGGSQERADSHMKRGEELFDSKNFEKARLEFKNVLKIDPEHVAALYRLGQVHEYEKEWKSASSAYNRAIELDDSHIDARVRLGRMYLAGKMTEKAAVLADEAMFRDGNNVGALTLRAGVRAQQNNLDGAERDLLAALKKDPLYEDAIMLLASLYVKTSQPEKAVTLLGAAVNKFPGKKLLRALLAQVYSLQDDTENALVQLKAIVALEPEELSHRVRVASYLLKLKRKGEAEKVLKKAIDIQPDNIDAKLTWVKFMASQGDKLKAEKQLKFYIKRQPDVFRFRFSLADFYKNSGAIEKVKSIYKDVIAKDQLGPDGLKARNKLALILIQMGDDENKNAGESLLEEVLENNPKDNEALLLRGRLALNKKDADTAIADFRMVSRDQPDSPRIFKLLAEAHLQNNEPELARDNLEQAIRLRPSDTDARLMLAKLSLKVGQADQAVEHLTSVLKGNPKQNTALELLFQAYVANKNWSAAGMIAEKVREYFPDQSAGLFYSGIVLRGQGHLKKSSAMFEKALEKSPKAQDILSALVKSYLAQEKPQLAIRRLDDLLARAKDNYAALNLKGEVLMLIKKPEPAVDVFKKVTHLKPKLLVGYRNLAQAYLASEKMDAAIKVYVDGIKENKNSSLLRVELAALYERVGQSDSAIAVYETLLKDQPGSVTLTNNLAMLLVTYRDDKASLDRAGQLVASMAENTDPRQLDTRGWVFYKRGDVDAAIPLMDRAVNLSPEEPQLRYHLGVAYFDKGNRVLAKEHLGRAVASRLNFPGKREAQKILDKMAQG